jgi:hypothetical protein
MGVEATAPPDSVVADVDPTSEDVAGFDLGSFWITRKSRNVWVMVSKDAGEAVWGKKVMGQVFLQAELQTQ